MRLAAVIAGLVTSPHFTVIAEEAGSQALLKVLAENRRGIPSGVRILGGHETTIAAHPWQVALVSTAVAANDKSQFCAGSIIAPRWVLTAAHCVDGGTTPAQIAILTGTASLLAGGTRVTVVPNNGIVVHDKWNPKNNDFDIALIHVEADLGGQAIVGFNSKDVSPNTTQTLIVTGWGSQSATSATGTNILQEVFVPYQSQDTCNKKGSYDKQVTQNMFCAGSTSGDTCVKDSGGPATFATPAQTKLIGIVSWGGPCGVPLKFGVYTRISQFVMWVNANSGGEVSW
jgi:transmembrane serine protease 11D